MYKSLAKKIVKALEPFKTAYTFETLIVPIKAIDDVPVEVHITAGLIDKNRYRLMLSITSEEEYHYEDEDDQEYAIPLWESKTYYIDSITTEVGTEFALEDIFVQVRELKFDKLQGVFKPKYEVEDLTEIYKFLETMPNVKLAFEECCVCHEPTQTKTCCGHKLCRKCMFSIKPIKDEQYGYHEINCPVCRETLGTR